MKTSAAAPGKELARGRHFAGFVQFFTHVENNQRLQHEDKSSIRRTGGGLRLQCTYKLLVRVARFFNGGSEGITGRSRAEGHRQQGGLSPTWHTRKQDLRAFRMKVDEMLWGEGACTIDDVVDAFCGCLLACAA